MNADQRQMHLLVDARNAIYRAVYAVRADQRPGIKYHYFVVMLRQMVNWMRNMTPDHVHVFWDAPRETVWRRMVLPTYKDRSTSNYVEGLAEDLAMTTAVAKAFFNVMGVRQYERQQMEADDLIYAAVSLLHPTNAVIVSSDSDMIQIPYRFSSCSVYEPTAAAMVKLPDCHPVHLKALVGDKADAIDGYYGIGPKKGLALLQNHNEFVEFMKLKGAAIFRRNLLLIDLSMCPRLFQNSIYVHKTMMKSVTFDNAEIQKLIVTHKVNGLQQEFADLVFPFKTLV